MKSEATANLGFCLLQHNFGVGGRMFRRQPVHEGSLLVDKVNILAGTQSASDFSHGNTLPLIARPWGFNHWAVQNQEGTAWYFNPGSEVFEGLRCTHQPSPWIGDYANFVILPSLGDDATVTYRADESTFKPYMLETNLTQHGKPIHFRMVPSMHGAILHVEFPEEHSGQLQFKYGGGDWQVSEGGLSGTDRGAKGGALHIFVETPDGAEGIVESNEKGVLKFKASPKGHRWTVRLATSFVSSDQAKKSLHQELAGKQLEDVKEEALGEWEDLLSRAKVTFSDAERSKVFYTNLYRGMLFPRFSWECDDEDQPMHFSPVAGDVRSGRLVTDEGFWDAYRTHYPMLSLIFPDRLGEIIDGWVNAYEDQGWLPTWPSPDQQFSMVGTMGDCSLADAIVKSTQGLLSGFNRSRALEAIFKDAFEEPDEETANRALGRVALKEYIEKGYVPSDTSNVRKVADHQSAALTLNYNVADACIALAAKAVGDDERAKVLADRSRSFKRIFDNSTGYFRPVRQDGSWDGNWDDEEAVTWGDGFTEASAAQYRFYAPHDVTGLTELMGGQEKLCKNIHAMLEDRFRFHAGSYGIKIHEMSEAEQVGSEGFGLYSHNNQPVHDVLYVAAAAGCRSMAQKTLRHVMSELYTLDGWSGDEDTGEMSSWYVLSSLGLYSLLPGSDDLILGSPEVTSAELRVPGRPVLTIEAEGNSKDNVYVQNVKLNGNTVSGASVKYTELAKRGGSLRFQMSSSAIDAL
eukprot:CAMPEP_0197666792 /NCGR_PEP_ID=MMETSP1338-20131121/63871_1 /TAXON_ID=43686 ORGANISM="Pelagodinium beii, Strain RCC1491" /NCGR_SAMPLE_ID=MMETSP1338 /ASSEMBLY_ACC=CAM_ASM_000754 /LENGTH=745 /DNA_ID=CAMNT_0043245883 /DNA_START=100 /DNA_END=2337 /DNA_ORIENTATION=-